MPKEKSFEEIYKEIEQAVAKMETSELSIEENIALYKATAEKISVAKKILEKMEAKIKEVKIDQ